ALGLHLALRAGCQPDEPAVPRPARGSRARVLSRRGRADPALPGAQRIGEGGAGRSAGGAFGPAGGHARRRDPESHLRRGQAPPFADLRAWFQALYEILIGQSTGPRMGSFIALYGIRETAALIRRVLAGENRNAA